jgi:type II secretory pathway pseudopilin PulG
MIGVLAVLAIVASLLVPAFVRKIDQAVRVRDAAELNGMATALQSVIQRTGQIPDASGLVAALANEMAVSPTQVATNSRNVPRAFLVDPALWIGSATGKLPYNEVLYPYGTGTNAGGIEAPGVNLRIMIISSISQFLPGTIDFNDAWSTPDGAIPSTWSSTWGRADDLKIQRLDFTRYFKRVILNPIDTNNFGSFAIESNQYISSTNEVTQALLNSWYLQGTALRLFDTNYVYGNRQMEMKSVIQNDTSFVFENSQWRGQLSGWAPNGPTPDSSLPSLSTAAELFTMFATNLSVAPLNPNADGQYGYSTLAILGDFYTFMDYYNNWAAGGFKNGPPEKAVQQVQTAIQNITLDMSQ